MSRVRIDHGVAVQTSAQVTRHVYTIRNSDITARTVIVEHPVHAGWTLAPGVAPIETSLGSYRFAVPVEAKGVATLAVEERRPTETRVTIAQLSDQQAVLFVRDTHENPQLIEALAPIRAKRAEIAAIATELDTRQQEATSIAEEQSRLRQNMSALKGSASEQFLLKRYVAQLTEQEDRIAVLRHETADREQKRAKAQADLAAVIDRLALDLEIAAGE